MKQRRRRLIPRIGVVVTVLLFAGLTWASIASRSSAPTAAPVERDLTAELALAAAVQGEVSLDRNFYVVFDGSGSMLDAGCAGRFPDRLEAAKWAVTEFATQSVPANVSLGLYAFDARGAGPRVPLNKDNREMMRQQIAQIRGGGATPLDTAITAGVTELATQRARQLGYGDFYLVVATDGEASDVAEARNAVQFAHKHAIPIITIGFCLDRDHALAGGSISYRSADNPQALLAALQQTQGESPYFDNSVFQKR